MKDKGRLRNFSQIRQLSATHGLGLDLDWGISSSKGIIEKVSGISTWTDWIIVSYNLKLSDTGYKSECPCF